MVREQYFGKAAALDLLSIDIGSACQENYIIDTQTGRVEDKVKSVLGASFRDNSSLLILNLAGPTNNYGSCLTCEPVVYVMEKGFLDNA